MGQLDEELYRRIIDSADEGIWVVDQDSITTFVNDKLAAMLGVSPEAMIGKSLFSLLDDEGREVAESGIERRRRGIREQVEFMFRRADGSELWTLITTNPFIDDQGRYCGALAMITDITAYRRAQQDSRRLAAIVQSSGDAIIGHTLEGTITSWNRGAEMLLGYSASEVLGRHISILALPNRTDKVADILDAVRRGDIVRGFETVAVCKDGGHVDISLTASPIYGADGTTVGISTVAHDVTDRNRIQAALQDSEERYRRLIDTSPDGIALLDLSGTMLMANEQVARLRGEQTPDALIGKPFLALIPAQAATKAAADFSEITTKGSISNREYTVSRPDGTRVIIDVNATLVPDRSGSPSEILVLTHDVTARRALEDQLRRQALFDDLTGLPNRTLLRDRLHQAILKVQREAGSASLLLLNLDHFKHVNDTFGHEHGDSLLQQVAQRLTRTVRRSDTVARLHGDEFALVLLSSDARGATRVARKIQTVLETPFELEGHSFHLGASIGIAVTPEHGEDTDVLLRRADVALYTAKRNRSRYTVYSPEQDGYSAERLVLMGELRDAIDTDHLVLHFQPKLDLKTGKARHAEALLRWFHPERGSVPPSEFIPLAEEIGLINRLGRHVLNSVRGQYERWREASLDVSIAVNLSAHNLYDRGVQAAIQAMFLRGHLRPGAVQIEITETALLSNFEEALIVLKRFHDLGAWIAIDDFGTGYSSLAYLAQLPVDEIKIDRAFVTDMLTNDTNRVIVRSIIDLAHTLGLVATAEGVEHRETWDCLAEMGCDMAQGFFMSRPLPADAFVDWLHSNQSGSASRAAS